ncbi:MAG TPA: hypothetical protein VK476_02185 [Flavobacterium sp.]|nr:hypothetical protein [Flavobacterium sp.]
MKNATKILVAILCTMFLSCNNASKIDSDWKAYQIGPTGPSNWVFKFDNGRVNAIHALMTGETESYSGTYAFNGKGAGFSTYLVKLKLLEGVALDYTMKVADNNENWFGLPDGSGGDKFEAIATNEIEQGSYVLFERK